MLSVQRASISSKVTRLRLGLRLRLRLRKRMSLSTAWDKHRTTNAPLIRVKNAIPAHCQVLADSSPGFGVQEFDVLCALGDKGDLAHLPTALRAQQREHLVVAGDRHLHTATTIKGGCAFMPAYDDHLVRRAQGLKL